MVNETFKLVFVSNLLKGGLDMKKNMISKCFVGVLVVTVVGSSFVQDCWARDGRGEHGGKGSHDKRSRHEVVVYRGSRYDFDHDRGRFFSRWFFGFPVVVSAPIGAIVASLPIGHATITIGGRRYYHHQKVYYTDASSGYLVVSDPTVRSTVIRVNDNNIEGNSVFVNIPNSNGSYTEVKLTKKDNGFVGPQGEFYAQHPTVEQLRVLYGK